MPAYLLQCSECGEKYPETICSMTERTSRRCIVCQGALQNDYSRQRTTNFQLKGSWPGKDLTLEGKILKDRSA